MNKSVKRTLALVLALVLAITAMPVNASAASTAVAVSTQAQLDKALKSKATQITIKTTKKKTFSVAKGTYKNVKLVVNSANATVKNKGVFKGVSIKNVKAFTEEASKNAITVSDTSLSVTVAASSKNSTIKTTGKNAKLTMVVNGTPKKLTVAGAGTNLNIKSGKTKATLPIVVDAAAKKSVIKTAVAADITLDAASTEIQTIGNAAVKVGGSQLPAQTVSNNPSALVTLKVAEAAVTGQGVDSQKHEWVDSAYNPYTNTVNNFGSKATITYTVPEGVSGSYDIYVKLSKSGYACGTTPVSVTVNGKQYYMTAQIVSCAPDYSDLFVMGTFLMADKVSIKAGDKIEVKGEPGYEMVFAGAGGLVSSMSSVGDLILAPAGTRVAQGYGGGIIKPVQKADASDPLSGLQIAWLGSSVTFGMQSGGYTMADYIADNHAATESYKYAISGTLLVDRGDGTSYVERLQRVDKTQKIDLLVVQLSTNDATQGAELGKVGTGKDKKDFDTATVDGAIEYIIAYARETWNCPVVFYTGSYYESEAYGKMVNDLLEIQKKWDIGVVDLWNNAEMTAIFGTELYNSYMADSIHPNRTGYVEWWTPKFEEYLTSYMK